MKEANHCPRCGGYLPTVTVRVLVPIPTSQEFNAPPATVIEEPGFTVSRYEEREEVGECVRCTGAY